jgi:hypothetical protein
MGAGGILALVGIYFEARWMVWIAIGVLLVGFALRLLPGEAEDPGEEGPEDTL